MEQLTLSFPLTESLTRENFQITDCNKEAVLWLDQFEKWPFRTLFLQGPEGSGKTHLSEVFKSSGKDKLVFEDLDRKMEKQEELFHLFNKVQEEKQYLLVTSRINLSNLPVTLKDLNSRLKAVQAVSLKSPDDEALRTILEKHFKNRQLTIPPESFSYLLTRIERSFEAMKGIAEEIDRRSLRDQRNITIPFLREILISKS